MLNDYIGGGQVFLHKTRMFFQVFGKTITLSLVVGFLASSSYYWSNFQTLEWHDFVAYRKALFLKSVHPSVLTMRHAVGNHGKYMPTIDVRASNGDYVSVPANKITTSTRFQLADHKGMSLLKSFMIFGSLSSLSTFILIFLIWVRTGRALKSETLLKQSNKVLTPKEVKKILTTLNQASFLKIGDMPLVKSSETRHFLITGSTGSGKTNLMHSLLTQITEESIEPAIVVDQTGEMIARYYTPERGDIIVNPLDARSANWDLFKDLSDKESIERFAKILFSYARNTTSHHSDPFWEESAATIFISCVEYLQMIDSPQISELVTMLTKCNLKTLAKLLKNTNASRLLEDSSKTSSSILSVLATYSKSLSYLKDISEDKQNTFSLKDHFRSIKNGKNAWLFLSTKPSARSLTIPLISCITELALAELVDNGITKDKKVWFVLDELPSLGRLPALSLLMTEGRKYGAAVIASLQSLNQLYDTYGHHKGSTIFGQFGTHSFFRNTEPLITKMISSMCGQETITKHNKNISFGANELRDGISYGEIEQRKNLVEETDIANLKVGECYVLLPEPKVRLARVTIKHVNASDKSDGFVQSVTAEPHITSHIASDEDKPKVDSTDNENEESDAILKSIDFAREQNTSDAKEHNSLPQNINNKKKTNRKVRSKQRLEL